jgi:16S rRNA (guanine966-N2)-methyltransferase
MMKIIAGEFRHRVLLSNPGLTTRPITARVKESLFARIEHRLPDARVADIFSGTGTLGFEALSRGAHSVVFIEKDKKAFELLKKNVAGLKVEDRTVCWATDALRSSYRPQRCEDFLPFDILFFDPPYRMASDLQPGTPIFKAMQRLARPETSSEDSWLLLRVPEHAEFEMPECWAEEWQLTMSNMTIYVCRKQLSAATVSDEIEETADESGH